MKMRYEPTLSYVRNSNEGAVYCAKYKGAADSIVWRLTDKGLLYMDAILLNRASGGGGFDDAFMDSKVFNLGLTFSYPEKNCSGMKFIFLTTHFPFLFPFSRSNKPRSIRKGVIRLTVRSDLPICMAISF